MMDECKVCANSGNEYCFVCDEGDRFEPMTNANLIRSMTDKELAKLMENIGCCPPRACTHNGVGVYVTPQDCKMCWLEWLKSPVEVDE